MITFTPSAPVAPLTAAERARRYIAKIPPAISGQRGHDVTFHVSGILVHGFGLDPETALDLLGEWNAGCVPPWSHRELIHKINSALTANHQFPRGHLLGEGATLDGTKVFPILERPFTPRPKWPPLDPVRRAQIIADAAENEEGNLLHRLWTSSPVKPTNGAPKTEQIIDQLFPGPNPWICVGLDKNSFKTRRREDLRGELSAYSFIVPSPMIAQTGRTLEGHLSERALANTGPRKYLVIEFDLREKDEAGNDTSDAEFIRASLKQGQKVSDISAGLLLHLAGFAPLVLAVHSGGKSVHGWFACGDAGEDRQRAFFAYAVSLGADSQMWTRSQFVRMPDGTRNTGARQTLWFINPEAMK